MAVLYGDDVKRTTTASAPTSPTSKLPFGAQGTATTFGATPKPATQAQPTATTTAAPSAAPPPAAAPLPLTMPVSKLGSLLGKATTPQVAQEGPGMTGAQPGMTVAPPGSTVTSTAQNITAPGATGQLPPSSAAPLPSVPGAQFSRFGPEGDLRSAQILPGQDVDRFKLAEDRYNDFITATEERDREAMRSIAQRNAAAGRLGSGMVREEFGDLAGDIERERGLARSGFLGDALEGTIGDYARYRDEARLERGYQQGSAQQSLENRLRQILTEEQLTQGQFGRDDARLRLLAQLGFLGNPADLMLEGAGQQQGVANQYGQGVYDLLGQYAYGRTTDPRANPPAGAPGGYDARTDPTSRGYYGERPGTYYYGGN